MKKLAKILLAAAVMSLSVGLFAGVSVSAMTYSGDLTGYDGETYQWFVDREDRTLTLHGRGQASLDASVDVPWIPYAGYIETIVADAGINPNGQLRMFDTKTFPNLTTVIGQGDGIAWNYDIPSQTLTVTGDGPWSSDSYPYGVADGYQKLIVEDGVTSFDMGVDLACKEVVLGDDVKLASPDQLNRFEKITVDPQNPYYSSYENCLYTKGYDKLLASPYYSTAVKLHPDVNVIGENSLPNGLTDTLVLPWGVTTVEKNVFNDFKNRVTVVIPDTVTSFDPGWNNSDKVIFMISQDNSLFDTLVKTGTEIWTTRSLSKYYPDGMPEEDRFAYYDGCKYTKDFRKLLSVPADKKEIRFHPNLKIIGTGSFDTQTPPETIVIPWGVTTIEDHAFNFFYASPMPNVILPDTVTSMQQDTAGGKDSKVTFTYSRSNLAVHNAVGDVIDSIYGFALGNPVDSVDQYYPDRPVDPAQSSKKGWAMENGKWYYYKDGHRTSGWILDQGTWYYLDVTGVMKTGWLNYNGSTYYLRPWGGMMVNGWYQIDGKWYYFQSWGGTAKRQWIYGLDKKWYYVGSDGVMLTNAQTPDGYWVDKNGVWVR